jgi:DNA polymerase alpha subunit A
MVDEDTYQKIVKKRFDEEDFVVDDDGQGYVDTGYDDVDDFSGGSDEENGGRKRKKKDDHRDGAKQPVKRINQFFIGNAKQFSDSVGPKVNINITDTNTNTNTIL